MTQDNHKPFYSLSEYYKERYGEKVYKIAIDGGFTCPNRDGTLDSLGCIFCSKDGSGDFASHRDLDMSTRVLEAKKLIQQKSKAKKFIVYFQSFTNTYDSVENLQAIYESALIDSSIVGLSIATRPDCLSTEVITLLEMLNQRIDIYIELGLQTIHNSSSEFIRRGYSLNVYDEAVDALNKASIPVITHVILGLPNESLEDMKKTVDYVSQSTVQGIKLQLLHILKDTDLYTYYKEHPFFIFSQENYVSFIVSLIETLNPKIVIHRITGDGPKHLLVEPTWSLNKRQVLNDISKKFKELDTYQGKYFLLS